MAPESRRFSFARCRRVQGLRESPIGIVDLVDSGVVVRRTRSVVGPGRHHRPGGSGRILVAGLLYDSLLIPIGPFESLYIAKGVREFLATLADGCGLHANVVPVQSGAAYYGNQAFVQTFTEELGSDFRTVEGGTVGWDQWMQDEIEFGMFTAPGFQMDFVLDSIRSSNPRSLDPYA